jgi:hypothetical protein
MQSITKYFYLILKNKDPDFHLKATMLTSTEINIQPQRPNIEPQALFLTFI